MPVSHASAYWLDLEREVAKRVREGLVCSAKEREPTVVFLRDVEEQARREFDRNQSVQMMASGRPLLSDKSKLGKAAGEYADSLGKRS